MSDETIRLGRRGALKLIATTAAAVPVLGCSPKEASVAGQAELKPAAPDDKQTSAAPKKAQRSPTDPDLLNPVIPWEFVLGPAELATLAALCDVIIPADETSPGAASLGAQDFINEWVSAPYDNNKKDLVLVRGGIVWLNGESSRRFKRVFADLDEMQKRAICDDIKWEKNAKPAFQAGARFFAKIRNLTASAFYTTEEGMADIGYVGNKALASFDGPPPEVLKKLGLD